MVGGASPQAQLLGDSSPLSHSPRPWLHRGDPTPLGCPDSGSRAPAASSPWPPPSPTQTPVLADAHKLFARFDTKISPKIHIKGLLRATANGNISPGTAACEQRRVEGKQAASPPALPFAPSPSSASRDPSPPPRGSPPSPGTAGDRGVPNPRGTSGLGPLVPPCVALSINTRGDTAWLSPTPLPPREITGAPSFSRGHPTGGPALSPRAVSRSWGAARSRGSGTGGGGCGTHFALQICG